MNYLKTLLDRVGLYQRLRASCLYDIYWTILNKTYIEEREKELLFYQELLQGFRKDDLVYDIGANIGYKTDIFLRLGAHVIAVDPDPFNQKILSQKFLSYRIHKKPVVIVDKAISNQNSVQTLWIDEPGSAKNTLSKKWVTTLQKDTDRFGETLNFANKKSVSTITLMDLIATYGPPFFIKIDVEGHEPSVLESLKQPVPYISFEVNLPEFKEEGVQCIKLLVDIEKNGEFNYANSLFNGLSLKQWLSATEFLDVFNQCKESSIEVFWRTYIPNS